LVAKPVGAPVPALAASVVSNGDAPGRSVRAAGTGLGHAVRALRHENFRLFFIGQGLSLPGTWMQRVAIAWLAYQLSGSALALGLVEFAAQIPVLLLGPFAGVIADRTNRRRLLMSTQLLAMAEAGILAVLFLAGVLEVWHLVVLSLLQGALSPFDQTARQTLMLRLVDDDRQDLASAVGLNSTMQTIARTVGPAAAGLLLAAAGAGLCFVLNSLSFLPLLAVLGMMKLRDERDRRVHASGVQALRQSFSAAFRLPAARDVLTMLGLGSLFGIPFVVLMPVLVTETLAGGPRLLGFLLATYGAGALVGAIYLAARQRGGGFQGLVVLATAVFGVGLVGLGAAGALWVAVLFLMVAGFGMMVMVAATNIFLQSSVEDENRGRLMSWYTMTLNGPTPFGSLAAGALATTVGAPITIMVGGAACLLGALVVHARRLALLRLEVRRAHANPS
jgi:MFS family permease